MAKKIALIIGISGQDGAYLAKVLLNKSYEVYGSSRDAQMTEFRNLKRLGIYRQVKVVSISIIDFRSVLQALTQITPNEVYNLAGQSSVGLSFTQPVETMESCVTGTLNLLEAIRFSGLPVKFYNAGSSECFGDTGRVLADEETPFNPRSPYGVAKAAAFWLTANYREAYDLFACTGILFNHESPLRPKRFVTQKIIREACLIASGRQKKLRLGNINIMRDWGWAPEYVEAMWRMLQHPDPEDYVIATGETSSLQEFVDVAFSYCGLDWHNHVVQDPLLYRPTDLTVGRANPSKAFEKLKWRAKYKMTDIVKMMVDAEKERLAKLE